MIWDPSGLEVHTISPNTVDSDQLDVTITLNGTGFDTPFFAIFVAHDTREVIPCNNPTLVTGNSVATVRICANGKVAGHYDLIMWLPPPVSVRDAAKQEVPNIPVNATYIFKKALHVIAKPMRTKR